MSGGQSQAGQGMSGQGVGNPNRAQTRRHEHKHLRVHGQNGAQRSSGNQNRSQIGQ